MSDQNNANNHDVEVVDGLEVNKIGNSSHTGQNRVWLIIISVLLFILVMFNVIQFITTNKQNQVNAARAATYENRVKEAQKLLETQQDVITNLMSDYEQAVYNNPEVDTIYHQQLIASEYSIVGLQIIAIQNTQIIQLLASMP